MIVAIDGPAAAGKGTLARRLSEKFNLALLDTGLLYRAVGMKTVRAGEDPENGGCATAQAESLTPQDLQADGLRTDEAAVAASKVAAIPGVRAALLTFQRDFAANPPGATSGAILDGRDIGTTVCPDADVKLFITASTEVRAERRLKELQESGDEAIYARVLQDMKDRDARDSGRAASPLKAADDAYPLDTSELNADQAFDAAVAFMEKQIGSA